MVTVAGSLTAPGDLLDQPADYPGFAPFGWTRQFQARLGRLLASDAVDTRDGQVVADEGAAREVSAAASTPPDGTAVARLEGVRLAAREIAHLVNNDLAVTVGTLDLLRGRQDVPPRVKALLEQALAGLSAATVHVERLQRVQRVVTRETPAGPSLDLERSV